MNIFEYTKCPKCKRKIKAVLKSNFWVKWIEIYCEDCDYRKIIKDKEFDYIQPSSPFFKEIYGNDPYALAARNYREQKLKKEKEKEARENNLDLKVRQGLLKSHEAREVKKYVKENKLE